MSAGFRSAYLSARHMRRHELLVAKERLESIGVEVTARWLDSLEQPREIAQVSREDIELADAYVLLGDERGDSGHRHVEFGLAMALGKPIIVVAPAAENIWQRLPGVTIVPEWEAVYKLAKGE